MTLIDYVRRLAVDQIDELMSDQAVQGRGLDVCQAIINEKVGGKVYDVPDISTFDGPEKQEAQILPCTREDRAIGMQFPWDLLYFGALIGERRFRKWRLWLASKAPRKPSKEE